MGLGITAGGVLDRHPAHLPVSLGIITIPIRAYLGPQGTYPHIQSLRE